MMAQAMIRRDHYIKEHIKFSLSAMIRDECISLYVEVIWCVSKADVYNELFLWLVIFAYVENVLGQQWAICRQ